MKTPKQLRDEAAERQRKCRANRLQRGDKPYLRHFPENLHDAMDLELKRLKQENTKP